MSGRISANKVRFSSCGEGLSEDVAVEVLGPLLQPASEMTQGDKQRIWIQPEESRVIREKCMETINRVRQRNESEQENPLSYTNVYIDAHNAVKAGESISQKTLNYFFYWVRVSPSKRGIEKVCIVELNTARKLRVKACIRAVLDTQVYCENRGLDRGHELQTKALRMASEHFSVSDLKFANLVGEADAAAALSDSCDHRKKTTRARRRKISGSSSKNEGSVSHEDHEDPEDEELSTGESGVQPTSPTVLVA